MTTINWVGTGLSSIPGLRRLIESGRRVVVWNRTVEKAKAALAGLDVEIREFDLDALAGSLDEGDLAVSMLPGDWHVPIAKACLAARAHFVSSSYISPEMADLDSEARDNGVVLINEVGLDPGIDHLMAHHLVADYKASGVADDANEITFRSYCGGIPKTPNDFRYKFSWSPLGVLKALKSPSRSIKDFREHNVSRPWDDITSYVAPLPEPESFEVYPNRNSLPFMKDYDFGDTWNVKTFVRGTMRLNGWADAWSDIFKEIETLSGEHGDARLKEMSDQFWNEHAFDEGEEDRVVLCVELKAERDEGILYHKTYVLDAWGDERGSAMARLVSITVLLAVEAALSGEIQPGVSAAPSSPELVDGWLDALGSQAQHVQIVDHRVQA